MENGKLAAALSLVAGVVIGVNWPKIKKFLPKARERVTELVEMAKETVADTTKKLSQQVASVKEKAEELAETATEKVASTTKKLTHHPGGRGRKRKLARA